MLSLDRGHPVTITIITLIMVLHASDNSLQTTPNCSSIVGIPVRSAITKGHRALSSKSGHGKLEKIELEPILQQCSTMDTRIRST